MTTPSGEGALSGVNGFNPYAFAAHYNFMQYAAMAAAASASNPQNGSMVPANVANTNGVPIGGVPESTVASTSRVAAPSTTISMGSEEYEEFLVTYLRDKLAKGRTHRQALESLHEIHGFSSTSWKDYFLDHLPRLLNRMSQLKLPATDSSSISTSSPSRPVPASVSGRDVQSAREEDISSRSVRERRPSAKASGARPLSQPPVITPSRSRQEKKERNFSVSLPPTPMLRKRRQSTAAVSGRDGSPEPPSAKSIVQLRNGRNMFTDEDKDFLVSYLNHILRGKLATSRSQICSMLEKKAPHHGIESWRGLWKNMDGLPRQLQYEHVDIAAATAEQGALKRKRTEQVTDEDLGAISRYIVAKGSGWRLLSDSERWEPFVAENPKRSQGAWREVYRTRKDVIDRMVQQLTEGCEGDEGDQPTSQSYKRVEETGRRRGPGRPSKRPRYEDESVH